MMPFEPFRKGEGRPGFTGKPHTGSPGPQQSRQRKGCSQRPLSSFTLLLWGRHFPRRKSGTGSGLLHASTALGDAIESSVDDTHPPPTRRLLSLKSRRALRGSYDSGADPVLVGMTDERRDDLEIYEIPEASDRDWGAGSGRLIEESGGGRIQR